MRFLLQTTGVLVAALLVARLVFAGAGPRRYALACLAVAACVSVPLAFASMGSQLEQFAQQWPTRDAAAADACPKPPCRPFTDVDVQNIYGQRLGVNIAFLDWVQARLPPGDSYYLVMPQGPELAGTPHWITYRMLPHLPTDIEGQPGNYKPRSPSAANAAKADWIVFYSVDTRRWALRKRFRLRVETFAPGFALARRRT
jgi:hypothetical protein